jgi:hypothetical protein
MSFSCRRHSPSSAAGPLADRGSIVRNDPGCQQPHGRHASFGKIPSTHQSVVDSFWLYRLRHQCHARFTEMRELGASRSGILSGDTHLADYWWSPSVPETGAGSPEMKRRVRVLAIPCRAKCCDSNSYFVMATFRGFGSWTWPRRGSAFSSPLEPNQKHLPVCSYIAFDATWGNGASGSQPFAVSRIIHSVRTPPTSGS